MRTTETSVREMIERAIELARRKSVWWQLVNKTNFVANEAVVNEHEDFFAAVSQALFESFVMNAYQLYEHRKGTISIPSLIVDLSESNAQLSAELTALVEMHRPLLVKAFAIRCGVYAHRSKKQPPEAIFSAKGLTASDMETIVRFTTEIVSFMAEAAGIDTKAEVSEEIDRRGVCSGDDTMLLISALREHAL
jgi:hypothetical protein